jgi:hypothetical protein
MASPTVTTDLDELEDRRERADLADHIGLAFASVCRPDPPITEDGPLNEDVERALAWKSREQITAADASEVRTDLSSLKPEAFVYYLPALLRVILIGDSYVDSLDASVLALLLPREGRAADRDFERRMALLDRPQRSALARYVDWCVDGESGLPGRERALAYWRA